MDHKIVQLLSLAFAFLLAACNGNAGGHLSVSNPQAMVPTNGLPSQQLDKGQCGIFLWGDGQGRPLVFFQQAGRDAAAAFYDDAAHTLTRSSAEGEVIAGFFAQQNFTAGTDDVRLKMQVEPARNVVEGIRIPSAVITITKANNAQTIMAASGLFGCQM